MSINNKTARIKAKIFLFTKPDYPLCWFNFERKRNQSDDYIIRDMAKRIRTKYLDELKLVIFYSNEQNPEISQSIELARMTTHDKYPKMSKIL